MWNETTNKINPLSFDRVLETQPLMLQIWRDLAPDWLDILAFIVQNN
jgi:hypothetical protein